MDNWLLQVVLWSPHSPCGRQPHPQINKCGGWPWTSEAPTSISKVLDYKHELLPSLSFGPDYPPPVSFPSAPPMDVCLYNQTPFWGGRGSLSLGPGAHWLLGSSSPVLQLKLKSLLHKKHFAIWLNSLASLPLKEVSYSLVSLGPDEQQRTVFKSWSCCLYLLVSEITGMLGPGSVQMLKWNLKKKKKLLII